MTEETIEETIEDTIEDDEIKTKLDYFSDFFLEKSDTRLNELINSGDLTGEEKASAIVGLIDSSYRNALLAIKLPYEIKELEASITLRNVQISLQSQKLATAIELAPLEIASAQLDNEIKEHKVMTTLDLNDEKIIAETDYTKTQKDQLIASVEYNNQIKALSAMGDIFGTMGAGGLVVPSVGWEFIFDIAKTLSQTTITIDSSTFQDDVKKK